MVQAAEDRTCHHTALCRQSMPMRLERHRQCSRWLRDAWTQGHVRAPSIVMRDPLHEDVPQVVCRYGNQVIYAFAPQCAQQPLAERVRLGTLGWGFQDPEPEGV